MRVALLIGTLAELDSRHALYANTLAADGHGVWLGSINSLTGAGKEVRSGTPLSTDQRRLCERVGERPPRHGIRFAGVDLAYPYVFECNVVNPGGLDERLALGLPDRSPEIIEGSLQSCETSR